MGGTGTPGHPSVHCAMSLLGDMGTGQPGPSFQPRILLVVAVSPTAEPGSSSVTASEQRGTGHAAHRWGPVPQIGHHLSQVTLCVPDQGRRPEESR
jgi:hypothetical protein